MTSEGHITHNTAGRINVERGPNSVTLRLWAWSVSPVAVLAPAEARKLIEKLTAALKATTASDAEDPYDVG